MTGFKQFVIAALTLATGIIASPALAGDVSHSTPGLSEYDPVAYFTDAKPTRGSGYQ